MEWSAVPTGCLAGCPLRLTVICQWCVMILSSWSQEDSHEGKFVVIFPYISIVITICVRWIMPVLIVWQMGVCRREVVVVVNGHAESRWGSVYVWGGEQDAEMRGGWKQNRTALTTEPKDKEKIGLADRKGCLGVWSCYMKGDRKKNCFCMATKGSLRKTHHWHKPFCSLYHEK